MSWGVPPPQEPTKNDPNSRYLDIYDCCPCCPGGKCTGLRATMHPHSHPCPIHPEDPDD